MKVDNFFKSFYILAALLEPVVEICRLKLLFFKSKEIGAFFFTKIFFYMCQNHIFQV